MISVIIPVYNVEQYLERCLESVIHQTYQDLEIILVDDGSTDNSPSICDKYKEKDSRIKVIHKENGGLSDARNVGFENSNGNLVFFLDSDDWLDEKAIEMLFNSIKENNADISICNFCYQYDDHSILNYEIDTDIVLDKTQAMEELLKNKIIKNFAWGKLYKRELVENHPFPKGKLFEDTYWTHLIFHEANRIVQIKENLLYYYQRNSSISYTFNVNRVHLIEGNLERRKFIQENYPRLLEIIDKLIVELMYGIYLDSIRNFRFKTYLYIRKYVKETANSLLKNKLTIEQKNLIKLRYLNKLPELCLWIKLKEKL